MNIADAPSAPYTQVGRGQTFGHVVEQMNAQFSLFRVIDNLYVINSI